MLVDQTKEGLGWVTRSMGLNLGGLFVTPGELLDKLNEISDQITELQQALKQDAAKFLLLTQVTDLQNNAVNPLDSASGALQVQTQIYVNNPEQYTAPITYSNSSPTFGNALTANITTAALNITNDQQNVNSILTALSGPAPAGPSSRLERLLAGVRLPPMGISTSLASFDGYEARSNFVTNTSTNMISYYCNYLELGFNLLAENSHLPGQNTLADQITVIQGQGVPQANQVTLPQVSSQMKLIQQQVPDMAPSDFIFVDLQHAKVWYMRSWGNLKNKQAFSIAANFSGSDGYNTGAGYGVWRIPLESELKGLYQYLEAGDKSQSVSDGKKSQVLERMGFDLSGMESSTSAWTAARPATPTPTILTTCCWSMTRAARPTPPMAPPSTTLPAMTWACGA